MEKSRTKNTINNMKTGMMVQIVNKVMAFVVRSVFIKILNVEYLGVNGLFTNILTMLSFAELGIGTAIIFNMYKPVAEDDKEKIKSLMQLYKKSYNIIGITVFLLGLLVIPFMDIIINDVPSIKENIIGIYILFLINTASSYFFTYKKSIISAYQQESIINKIDSIFYLLKSVFEILFLILTKNYIVYLMVSIAVTIIENVYIAHKANKMFPFLKEKEVQNLPKNEISKIFSNVKSLIVYKFGSVIMSGTDNILISAMINVETVGLCSNYTLIINAIKNIVTSTLNGVIASVGNLNAVSNKEKKEQVFYQLIFINFWVYAFCAISFIILLNPFIKIWLGEEYILGIGIPISLAVSFFIEGLRMPSYTYRVTMGLFDKGKMTPYIGALTNVVFSILLGKLWGAEGIFIATSIAQLLSYAWIDPYLIYKYEFKKSIGIYFKKCLKYIVIFIVVLLITLIVTNFIQDKNIYSFAIKAVLVLIISNSLIFIFLRKSEEFIEIQGKFINMIREKHK